MTGRKGAVHRSITLLSFLALIVTLLSAQTAPAAQICACQKSSNGKIKKATGAPALPTCSASYTTVCWNEDPVGAPGEISVRVFNSASFNINDNSQTPLTWDMEEWKTDPLLHSNTTNTSRLTAPVSGKYLVFGSVDWNNVGSAGNRTVALRLNNSRILAAQTMQGGTGNPFGNYQSVSTVAELGVGDFVECVVHQQTGASLAVAGGSNESGCGMTRMP